MKIGIISDLHLGYRQYGLKDRENDFYTQYKKCIKTIVEEECDYAIFAGDIFDTHKPSPVAINIFGTGLSLLNKNNISVFNIVGNHTQLQVKDYFEPDKLFLGKYDYHILSEEYTFTNNGLFICGLPYYANHSLDKLKEQISILNNEAAQHKCSILVLHQEFQEYCGFTGAHLSINDIDISNFDVVICGHIHSRDIDTIDDLLYIQPGSIERMNMTESEDEKKMGKGVTILEINDDYQCFTNFIRIECPRKIFSEKIIVSDDIDITNASFQNILDKLDDEESIVSMKVYDEYGYLELCKDWSSRISDATLMARMTYYNEQEMNIANVDNIDHGLTPLGALKHAVSDWDSDKQDLAIDLFLKLSSDDKEVVVSAAKLTSDYLEKHYDNL